MSCNYVQQPGTEDDQCSNNPSFMVMHKPGAEWWFEACENHLIESCRGSHG
jgi:hypothetical protein